MNLMTSGVIAGTWLTEQAIRIKRAPSAVMIEQLRHLGEVAQRPNVD